MQNQAPIARKEWGAGGVIGGNQVEEFAKAVSSASHAAGVSEATT